MKILLKTIISFFFKIKRATPSWYIIAGLVFFAHFNISHLKSAFAEVRKSVEESGWREIQLRIDSFGTLIVFN